MQVVSTQFGNAAKADVKTPQPGFLISWKKNISSSVKFFTLDHSYLDGPDKLKGSGDTVTFFDKYDYQDETAFVKHFRVTKKISNRPWGVIMAQAEIELDNSSKRFLPGFNADIGAYTTLPDRPVKLSVGFNGEFVKLFTGYTGRPAHTLGARTTTLTAFDAMTYLSTVKSSHGAFVNMYMHDIISQLLIEQGFAIDQFNLEPSLQQPIGYLMPGDRYLTDIFNKFCEAEGYILHSDEDGIIQGWNRLHFLGQSTSVWDFTYSNMVDLQWSSSPIINSATVNAKPMKPVARNKMFTLDRASDETMIPPGQSKDIFATFQDSDGTFNAITVETPVYVDSNTGSSIYSTNMNVDGSGPTGSSSITLSSTYNFGDRYRMTFTNSGAQPVWITNITLYGQPAKLVAIQPAMQEDTISSESYGLNPDNNGEPYTIDNEFIQDYATANSVAWSLVNLYKDPLNRYDIDKFVVPHLQFGDPVSIHIKDTATTKPTRIFGQEFFLGVSGQFTHKVYAEERQQFSYFRLDGSHLDGSDVLAL